MSQVITLFRLQKIDSQRDRILTRLTKIEREMKEDVILREAHLMHDQALEAEHQALEHERSTEEAVSGIQIKLEHNQSSQFGEKVFSPKELQDLQSEQGALERRRTELEEEQLNAMLTLEKAETTMKEAEANLALAEQKASNQQALLRGEMNTLKQELEKAEAERQAILSTVSSDLAGSYEKLRIQKKGVAVAIIADESCAACGSSLTPAECQAARSPSMINYCPSCGRILYAG
jgi:predicted  nucleic acid-binding Zn-ribbon protein